MIYITFKTTKLFLQQKQNHRMNIPNKYQEFKDFEVVYADSLEAINLISAQGLPKNCIIKTLSPYIIFSKKKM